MLQVGSENVSKHGMDTKLQPGLAVNKDEEPVNLTRLKSRASGGVTAKLLSFNALQPTDILRSYSAHELHTDIPFHHFLRQSSLQNLCVPIPYTEHIPKLDGCSNTGLCCC